MLIREDIIERIRNGFSQSAVARELNISRFGVQSIWKKYVMSGHVNDLSRSGRPRVLDERSTRQLIRLSKKNPKATAPELKMEWETNRNISMSTVKRILRRHGLFGRIAAKKPLLTRKHVMRRKRWCSDYMNLGQSFWDSVIFTDECRFELYPRTREYVRRPTKTKYLERYTTKTVKHGGKSLMVWGAIKSDGSRTIIRCPGILNSVTYQDVLRSGLLPFYESTNVFQQDGAPCHTAASTISFLEKERICLLSDWPAQSPDLNIIESLWSKLKSRVCKRKTSNIDDLWNICEDEWYAIPNADIKNLFQSITRRLKDVIQKKGGHTSY